MDIAFLVLVGFLIALFFAERNARVAKGQRELADSDRIENNFKRRHQTGAGGFMFDQTPSREVIEMLNEIRAISDNDGSVFVKLRYGKREECKRIFVDSFRNGGFCFFGEITEFDGTKKKDYFGVSAENVISFFTDRGSVLNKL